MRRIAVIVTPQTRGQLAAHVINEHGRAAVSSGLDLAGLRRAHQQMHKYEQQHHKHAPARD